MVNKDNNEYQGRAELHLTTTEVELLDRARGTIERQPFCRQAAVWVARLPREEGGYHFDFAIPGRGAWQKERRKVVLSFNVVFSNAEHRKLVNQARGELPLSAFVYAASLTYAHLIIQFNHEHGIED